jgi:hypothetical protein
MAPLPPSAPFLRDSPGTYSFLPMDLHLREWATHDVGRLWLGRRPVLCTYAWLFFLAGSYIDEQKARLMRSVTQDNLTDAFKLALIATLYRADMPKAGSVGDQSFISFLALSLFLRSTRNILPTSGSGHRSTLHGGVMGKCPNSPSRKPSTLSLPC